MKASADEFVKKHWNKIDEKTYREAAAQAIERAVQQCLEQHIVTRDIDPKSTYGTAAVGAAIVATLQQETH